MLPIVINFLLVIHVLVSLLIILLVLMQRPKNEGLGAAFGGGMTENLFGAQTTNVLQTITRWLGGIFFVLTLLLSWLYVKNTGGSQSPIQRKLMEKTVIPAPATPAPAPEAVPPASTPAPAASDPVKPATPAPATPAPATPAPDVEKKPETPTPAAGEKPLEAPKPAEAPRP